MPSGRNRPSFRFPITNHRHRNQIRIIKNRPKSRRQTITQLPTFQNRPRNRRRHMRRKRRMRPRKIMNQITHPLSIHRIIPIKLFQSPLQKQIRQNRRRTMPRPRNKKHLCAMLRHQIIHLCINKIQPRHRPPMPQNPHLTIRRHNLPLHQTIILQIQRRRTNIIRITQILRQPNLSLLQFCLCHNFNFRNEGFLQSQS